MAITDPIILEVANAARIFFSYFAQTTDKAAQLAQIDTDINAFDTTGDIYVKDLDAVATVGTTQKNDITNDLATLDLEVNAAKLVLIDYFVGDIARTGLISDDATQKIEYDSGTGTLSIVPYP